MGATAWLLGLTLRCTLVLGALLALERALARQTAAARHTLLTLGAAGLLLLPALPWLLPRLELRLLPGSLEPAATTVAGPSRAPLAPTSAAKARVVARSASVPAGDRDDGAASVTSHASTRASLGSAAVVVWLTGVFAALVGLARGLLHEQRLRAASRRLLGDWSEVLAEAGRALGISGSVRLLSSDAVETPLTSGWPRPVVLLPPSAEAWTAEKRRVVVQHELVHVARGDAWRLLAWRLVAALYWFHPLARLAERHARLVGEQACDEAVVGLGTRPSAYARHLMEIAESLRVEPRRFALGLPMVERGQLERRLVMILDANRPVRRGGPAAALYIALLAAVVVAVSAASPRQQPGKATPTPAPVPAVASHAAVAASPAEGVVPRSACIDWADGSVSGTIREEFSDSDGDRGDFALQERLDGGRWLCARVHGPVRFDERDGSIRELGRGGSVLIETRGAGRSQRMLITGAPEGPRHQWWVSGAARTPDDAARAWLADALRVTAGYREIGAIQGKVGSLQGQIGEIQGEIGSLQGQIGELQGHVGGLQGKLGSIQGEQGSLQGEIGSHQGAIGGLQAGRSEASAGLRAQIDREIETHEVAIRKLESQLESGELPRRMKEAEAELQHAEAASRDQIAELERKIAALRGDEKIGKLERQIEEIHADERIGDIELRMKPARERLEQSMDRLGS